MAGLFKVVSKESGLESDVYDTRSVTIGGVDTEQFYIYNTRRGVFQWFPAPLFSIPADSGGIDPGIPIESVTLELETATVRMGADLVLNVIVTPSNADASNLDWTTSNPNIATVSAGLVTPVATGNCTITVDSGNGWKDSCEVTVLPAIVYVSDVQFVNQPPVQVLVGQEISVSVVTSPPNATNRRTMMDLISGGDHVFLDDSGANIAFVTGIEEGEAVIRATAADGGGATAQLTVTCLTTTASVSRQSELLAAAAAANINTIIFTADITTTSAVNIGRKITIDGGGFTLNFSGNDSALIINGDDSYVHNLAINNPSVSTGWEGEYGIQIYNSEGVILEDIEVHGEDGGILINGSIVTARGIISLNNNEFGGIEVSDGANPRFAAHLDCRSSTFVNTSEVYGSPTIWTDSEEATVSFSTGQFHVITLQGQLQYYVDQANTIAPGE